MVGEEYSWALSESWSGECYTASGRDLDDPGLTQSKFNNSNAAVQTLPQTHTVLVLVSSVMGD